MARVCIFCGERANTVEDVFPKWAIAILRMDGPIDGGEVIRGVDRGTRFHSPLPAGPRVKHVCASCNNGWMSDLETKCRPILGAMITGIAVSLDEGAQRLLSAWCLKTAIMVQCAGSARGRPHVREYGRNVHHSLRHLSPPSSDAFVWLARNSERRTVFAESIEMVTRVTEENPRPSHGQITTGALGHLAFQVFSIQRPPEHELIPTRLRMKPGPWSQSTLQIWPWAAHGHWPSPRSLTPIGLHQLSARFSPGGVR